MQNQINSIHIQKILVLVESCPITNAYDSKQNSHLESRLGVLLHMSHVI